MSVVTLYTLYAGICTQWKEQTWFWRVLPIQCLENVVCSTDWNPNKIGKTIDTIMWCTNFANFVGIISRKSIDSDVSIFRGVFNLSVYHYQSTAIFATPTHIMVSWSFRIVFQHAMHMLTNGVNNESTHAKIKAHNRTSTRRWLHCMFYYFYWYIFFLFVYLSSYMKINFSIHTNMYIE